MGFAVSAGFGAGVAETAGFVSGFGAGGDAGAAPTSVTGAGGDAAPTAGFGSQQVPERVIPHLGSTNSAGFCSTAAGSKLAGGAGAGAGSGTLALAVGGTGARHVGSEGGGGLWVHAAKVRMDARVMHLDIAPGRRPRSAMG